MYYADTTGASLGTSATDFGCYENFQYATNASNTPGVVLIASGAGSDVGKMVDYKLAYRGAYAIADDVITAGNA